MAVKSATKKKLVEQGVAPEHAHLLATDRNMADLKALSIDQIAEILSLSVDDEAVKRSLPANTGQRAPQSFRDQQARLHQHQSHRGRYDPTGEHEVQRAQSRVGAASGARPTRG